MTVAAETPTRAATAAAVTTLDEVYTESVENHVEPESPPFKEVALPQLTTQEQKVSDQCQKSKQEVHELKESLNERKNRKFEIKDKQGRTVVITKHREEISELMAQLEIEKRRRVELARKAEAI